MTPQPVQAHDTTFIGDGHHRAPTELARIIARHRGWLFQGDTLVTTTGQQVASSIEALADKAAAAGWIATGKVMWPNIPDDVRQCIDVLHR